MNTTNELPPQNTDQKLDLLIEMVNSFRTTLLERMDRLEEDSRSRYVDLRQRMEEMEKRLTERIDKLEERMAAVEMRLERLESRVEKIEQRLYTLDKNIDAFLREMLYVKDRVNELENTRPLH